MFAKQKASLQHPPLQTLVKHSILNENSFTMHCVSGSVLPLAIVKENESC